MKKTNKTSDKKKTIKDKETKKEEKVISKKNYISLMIIFFVTILAVLGMKLMYRSYNEYKLTIPVIKGKIAEVNINELDEYITAHDDFYLYVGVSDDKNCREIEKKLDKLLKDRNIKDDTVYLNVSDIDNAKETVLLKLQKYGDLNKNFSYPLFLMFKNGKILGKVDKNFKNVDIGDIEKLLDEYEVGVK